MLRGVLEHFSAGDYDMSHTNFVLANVAGGTAFARKLEKHGLIVRPVTSCGLTDWVRISIGTSSEIDRFLKAARPE